MLANTLKAGAAVSVAALATFTLTGCAGSDVPEGWPETLVVGAVPSEESQSLIESYAPLVEALEEDLGIPVEFTQATDYAGVIEGQVAERVHLAQYGPFSYVLAGYRGAELDVVGVMTDGPDVEPGYQSYGIANPDSGIESIEDFAGKTVCFVDPASTSGFLYPSEGLLSAGIDPDPDSTTEITPVFAGGHDASVISVANGDCDAGFAFDAMVENILIDSGDINEGDVVTVWKSEVIAGSPLAMLTSLPTDLQERITDVVRNQVNTDQLIADGKCTSVDDCGITDENIWGWVQKPDSFFDGVRKVCEVTGASQCE